MFFSKIIILSLRNLKKNKIKIQFPNNFGFGDYVIFCIEMRNKINMSNKIFCYSKLQMEIASFIFSKEYIASSYILMPKFMNEGHIAYNFLLKNKYFNPINAYRITRNGRKIPISQLFDGTQSSIDFIKKRINFNKVSKKLVKACKKKTICIFIKNFSLKKNNHMNFQVRQTRKLDKIYNLIFFLNKKKINPIIIGNHKDHFIKLIKLENQKQNKMNFLLFKDLSSGYSIHDQAYLALNTTGYIGSESGAMTFFGLLNKKQIIVDAVFDKYHQYRKNITFLYKRLYDYKNKRSIIFYWDKRYDPKRYRIIENNYKKIHRALLKKIFNQKIK